MGRNNAVQAECKRVLIDDPHVPDGVKVLRVDEQVCRYTGRDDKNFTVIIGLTGDP